MVLDSPLAEVEPLGDLRVRQAVPEPGQGVPLTIRENAETSRPCSCSGGPGSAQPRRSSVGIPGGAHVLEARQRDPRFGHGCLAFLAAESLSQRHPRPGHLQRRLQPANPANAAARCSRAAVWSLVAQSACPSNRAPPCGDQVAAGPAAEFQHVPTLIAAGQCGLSQHLPQPGLLDVPRSGRSEAPLRRRERHGDLAASQIGRREGRHRYRAALEVGQELVGVCHATLPQAQVGEVLHGGR